MLIARLPEWSRWILLAATASLPFHELTFKVGSIGLRPFESLLIAAFALVLPVVWRDRSVWLRRRTFDVEVAVLLVLGAAAVLIAPGPGESARVFRLAILESAVYYALISRLFETSIQRQRLVVALILGGTLVGLYGLSTLVTEYGLVEAEGVVRISGAYRSPNNLALFLDRCIPFAVAFALTCRGRRRLVAIASAVVLLVAQAATFSIGGWFATGVAVIAVAAFLQQRRILVAIGVLGALSVAVLAVWRPERIMSHLDPSAASTSGLRVTLWRSALEMLWDFPLFGVGLDNFVYQYNPERGGTYLTPAGWREPDLSHPHNLFIDWCLSLGVLGFLLLIRILVKTVRLSILAARAPALLPTNRALTLGAIGALIATLIHGSMDNSFFLPDLAAVWWLVLVVLTPTVLDRGDVRSD